MERKRRAVRGAALSARAHAQLAAEPEPATPVSADRWLRGAQDAAPCGASADACNIFSRPDPAHKLDVLRAHCEREGRDYDEIEKTTILSMDASTTRDELLAELQRVREIGFTVAYIFSKDPDPLATVDLLASLVPEISAW